MDPSSPTLPTSSSSSSSSPAKKNAVRHLAAWTLAWLISTALATFGPLLLWDSQPLDAAVIALYLAVGAGMVRANIRHIRSLDELQQKIHTDAMGLTLGVGMVAGIGYSLLSTSGLIGAPAEISVLVAFLGLVYLATVIIQTRRYA